MCCSKESDDSLLVVDMDSVVEGGIVCPDGPSYDLTMRVPREETGSDERNER